MAHEIDQLAYSAVFGNDKSKAEARKQIHMRARKSGAVSSSIYPLYMAFGRNEIRKHFTVPAFNIRPLTYDAVAFCLVALLFLPARRAPRPPKQPEWASGME